MQLDITTQRLITRSVSLLAATVLHASKGNDLETRATYALRDARRFQEFMEGRR